MNEQKYETGDGFPAIPSCGDFEMRIAADGTWFHQGSPIGRIELVKLFSTVLRREADGSYWLVTPVERGRIIVDDAPYVANQVWQDGGDIWFKTNIGTEVRLDETHPLRVDISVQTQEPRPYLYLEKGLEARVVRSTFYHLVEMATLTVKDAGKNRREVMVVSSAGREFEIGSVT